MFISQKCDESNYIEYSATLFYNWPVLPSFYTHQFSAELEFQTSIGSHLRSWQIVNKNSKWHIYTIFMTRAWVDDGNLFDKRKTQQCWFQNLWVNPSIELSNTIVTVVIA